MKILQGKSKRFIAVVMCSQRTHCGEDGKLKLLKNLLLHYVYCIHLWSEYFKAGYDDLIRITMNDICVIILA